MNLNEKVPVLDYDNFIIYESNAIIKFIYEVNNFLIPADIKVNPLVNQCIDWASFTFGVPCQLLSAHMAHLPLEERDPKK
jgi:glutathione S-transferase